MATDTSEAGTSSNSTRLALSSMGGAMVSIADVEVPHDEDGSGLGADDGHRGGSQAVMVMDIDPPE